MDGFTDLLGKTVLASVVIEEARRLADTTVVFFYCKFGDELRNIFISVARGIVSQILKSQILRYRSNKPNAYESLLLYIDEKVSGSGETILTSSKLAKELLETAFKSCQKMYIVLDGLDECNREERKEISAWFR